LKHALVLLLLAAIPWPEVGKQVAAYLDAHPNAAANDVAKSVKGVTTGALQLDRATWLVSAEYPKNGTFFVVTRGGVLWDIKPLAQRHLAKRDEIGKWAWTGGGWGDGPLLPSIGAARASRSGHPRFYVDATADTDAGGTYAKQISVWEWNGREAVPLLIKSYATSIETGPDVLTSDLLTIRTKGSYKAFYSCGACVEPEQLWRISITPDGVRDLGRTDVVPELRRFDELVDRVIHHRSTAALATTAVVKLVRSRLDGDTLGMLGDFHVSRSGHGGVLYFDSDLLEGHALRLEIDGRPGKPYFTKANEGK
jgi:hypothetical protein